MGLATGTRLAAVVAASGLWLAPELAGAAPSGGEGSLSADGPGKAVTVRLLADAATIAPGRPFDLGIELRMQEGWHTYWENGGDAGLPTTVEWSLPEGFRAGPIRWPVPHRYEEEGDLVTFGYADRVLLLTEVQPPATLPEGRVRISGRVDWLECKDICVPGSAEVDLLLPVGVAPLPAPGPVAARFRETREQLPRSAVSLPNVGVQAFQSLSAVPPGGEAEVAVVFTGLGGVDVEHSEFFPRASDHLLMRDGRLRSDGENLALVVPVVVGEGAPSGTVVSLPGVLRLAAEKELLVSFEVPVTLAEEGAAGVPSDAPVFRADSASMLDAEAASAPVSGAALLRFLLFAFLGGIILNVMPCVLPVISLKILGFVSHAEEHPRKVAALGWTFAAGVVASFLVLAALVIALKAAGEHVGWGFQFQNPGFVAAVAVVVFLFALNLLGVFSIRVFDVGAQKTASGLGPFLEQRKDYADAFFHGILTTILATPCTAPMLGAAVAFALAQPAPVILLVFFTVAAGLAAPYVVLSLNPAWLRHLPRPGIWMERFKQMMGFLLLATLVWLLFVLGAQTGTDTLSWFLAFLLVLGFFAWLHGSFLTLSASRTRIAVVWLLTLAGTGLGYRAFVHERFFGPKAERGGGAAEASVEVTSGGIRWEPFSVSYLEESVRSGRTVFLDFTADWCWTCKVNEKTVLADTEVERAFQANDVLTLKGDWTSKDPEITQILQRHGRAGVPFYVVYPAGRISEPIVLPEIINKRLVLDSIRRAGPSAPGEGA